MQLCADRPALDLLSAVLRRMAHSRRTYLNYVQHLGYPGIDMSSSRLGVTATWPTTGAACTPIASPCNNPGNLVKVVVTYQYPLAIPFVPKANLNMSSTSEMVISQ